MKYAFFSWDSIHVQKLPAALFGLLSRRLHSNDLSPVRPRSSDALGSFGRTRQEVLMVVGRTLWDFVFEMLQAPRLRLILLAALVFLDLIIIILLLLMHAGLINIRLGYGGLSVEVHHLLLPILLKKAL
jgi:hypothetical protein